MVYKGKKRAALPNNVRTIRTSEGLKITELAKLADVSTQSLAGIESRRRNLSVELKHKIVNGLNKHPPRKRDYGFHDVFPHDSEV
jgi:DNA-binding XRE family transcriptional regulator